MIFQVNDVLALVKLCKETKVNNALFEVMMFVLFFPHFVCSGSNCCLSVVSDDPPVYESQGGTDVLQTSLRRERGREMHPASLYPPVSGRLQLGPFPVSKC